MKKLLIINVQLVFVSKVGLMILNVLGSYILFQTLNYYFSAVSKHDYFI